MEVPIDVEACMDSLKSIVADVACVHLGRNSFVKASDRYGLEPTYWNYSLVVVVRKHDVVAAGNNPNGHSVVAGTWVYSIRFVC